MVELLDFLVAAYDTPLVFLPLVFAYAVAVAVVLPIPIETILIVPILQGRWEYLVAIAAALAAGKAVGAWLIFLLGLKVEDNIRRWSTRSRFADWIVRKMEAFVRLTGSLGLYVLLSIPLMSDTIPIYLYALFNEEGQALDKRQFLLGNFLAAINRVALVALISLPFR